MSMAAALSIEDDIKGHASAVMVVLDIFPEMMRAMIVNIWPPKMVLMQIKNEKTFLNNVTPLQKKMILKLESDGYNVLDISCLYKVIRNFNLLPCPKQGWGQKPKPEDISEGDDVERMTRHRNDIIHRPRGGLAESERNRFFQESIEIAKRMDRKIGSPKNGFESRIEKIKSYSVTRQQYLEAIEKCAEYQERLRETSKTPSFDLWYGNDIKIKTDNKELSGDRSTSCILYLKDPDFDVTAIIRMLDKIKDKLNKGSYGISLEDAEIGSLNLHVTILNRCFNTKEFLHKSIQSFLQHFFQVAQIRCNIMQTYTVVLAESDDLVAENELTRRNDFDYLKEIPSPVLKFNVNVKNSAFVDKLKLYREVGRFITGMYNAVDRHNVPVNGSAREVLMLTSEKPPISCSEANQDPQLSLPITKHSDKTSSVSSSSTSSFPSYQAGKSDELRKSFRRLKKKEENQLPMEQATNPSTNIEEWLNKKQVFPNKYDRSQSKANPHGPLYKPSTSIANMTSRDIKTGNKTSTVKKISSVNIYGRIKNLSSASFYQADQKWFTSSAYLKQSPKQYQVSSHFTKQNSNDYTNLPDRQESVKKTNMMSYNSIPPIKQQEIEQEVHGLTKRYTRDLYSPQNPPRKDVPSFNYLPPIGKSHDKYTPWLKPQPSADPGGVNENQKNIRAFKDRTSSNFEGKISDRNASNHELKYNLFSTKFNMSKPDRESDLLCQSKSVSIKTDNRYTFQYRNYKENAISSKLKRDSGSKPVLSPDKYSKSSYFMNSDRARLRITDEGMFTHSKTRTSRHGHEESYESQPRHKNSDEEDRISLIDSEPDSNKHYSAPVMPTLALDVLAKQYQEYERRSKSSRVRSGLSRPRSDYIINSVN